MTRAALTIDTEHPDHPADPRNPEAVIAAFERAGARGTFFLQGRWTAANPRLARRIAEAGHLVCSHGNAHAPTDMLTDEGIETSLREARETIRRVTGVDPRPRFRLPYGDGDDDPRVLAAIERAGYRHIGWDVDTSDWEDGRTADGIVETVVTGCERHGDGAIVLMHSWPDPTVSALPLVIERLRTAGVELVGVDELG